MQTFKIGVFDTVIFVIRFIIYLTIKELTVNVAFVDLEPLADKSIQVLDP